MARLVLCVLLVALVALCKGDDDKYSSKFDHVDVDAVLANPRLRNQYLNCYLATAPCLTADAKFLRDKFPEALVTKCRKCTEKQREFFAKITEWYTENEPETWSRVIKKTIEDNQKRN